MSAHKIEIPLEFDFPNEAFALVPEYTQDSERIQRELDDAAAARTSQAKSQLNLKLEQTKVKP
jgi:hypothetical protein